MSRMKDVKVNTRKGQIIHTFGPGAMQVNKDGISLIACGLDHWFTESGTNRKLDESLILSKYSITDKRLEKKLGVNGFRTPPDISISHNGQKFTSPLPAKRFPYWHICSNTNCQRMRKSSNISNEEFTCNSCSAPMYQSRFVSVCEDGHLQDFPWHEWLNAHNNSNCTQENCELRLTGTGSTSVSDIRVMCVSCNSKPVSLAGIFQKVKNKTSDELSTTMSSKGVECSGHRPWLGNDYEKCKKPIVAALRQATNVYYSKTDTSILIPLDTSIDFNQIDEMYRNLDPNTKLTIEGSADFDLKVQFLDLALEHRFNSENLASYLKKRLESEESITEIESEVEYRSQEHSHFFKDNVDGVLVTKQIDTCKFSSWFKECFSNIIQVKELTVTNAFYGFDRISPQNTRNLKNYKNALRLSNNKNNNWLPAVNVYGEGIFIEFNAESIVEWSKIIFNKSVFRKLAGKKITNPLFDKVEEFSPAFLLIHTFAHLLINQLIFDCGYSTASLRERLYVSESEKTEMYGVLIYTAAGDSEGSLGGLVRMARQSTIENIIMKAIISSNWCSSDPICSEIGNQGGQGPDGMNLAACHNCTLLPETSCEMFNSLLDRGMITSHSLNGDGYFDKVLKEFS